MVASPGKAEPERVVRVDFSARRRALHPTLQGFGEGPALRVMSPARSVPAPGSVAALAHVIVEKADAHTIERDLEVICRLLRQNCSWSDERLVRLMRTVATVLDHPMR